MTATSPQTWLALRRRNRDEVRFSNRPFGVKRVQTTHHYSVVRGLVLFSGTGAKALPSGLMAYDTNYPDLLGRAATYIAISESFVQRVDQLIE